jgi:hypothetical protein
VLLIQRFVSSLGDQERGIFCRKSSVRQRKIFQMQKIAILHRSTFDKALATAIQNPSQSTTVVLRRTLSLKGSFWGVGGREKHQTV